MEFILVMKTFDSVPAKPEVLELPPVALKF
jgi:hypothetical protein